MEYQILADLYENLFSTSKRLEKTQYVADFLRKNLSSLTENDPLLRSCFLLLRGRVFPEWDTSKLGFAGRMVLKSLTLATGTRSDKLEQLWKKEGDLGLVAENAIAVKKQSVLFTESLTALKVFNTLKKIAVQEGNRSTDTKVKLLSELLTSASPREAKYVVRTVLEDMRIGLGDSTMRDAIALACFGVESADVSASEIKDASVENTDSNNDNRSNTNTATENTSSKDVRDALQNAYDISTDWAEVYAKAREGKHALSKIKLVVGRPLKLMLFPKALSFDDAFERLGKPCIFEYKYDGFRVAVHKKNNEVTLFTRRLENVTNQFPDVVTEVKKNISAESCICDAEIVGINPDDKTYQPFQHISKRIKRKHGIDEIIKELPVELHVFDILLYDGKSLLAEKFENRRHIIEKIISSNSSAIRPAVQLKTDSVQKAQKFFAEALAKGNEGLMAKKLDAPYKPGSRVGYGMKIKEMKESLDLVIVGAEYGEGKRAGWLSSFTVACVDEDGNILEIGKVSTGLKEKESEGVSFKQLTEQLKPLIIHESGRNVTIKPSVIIEVGHEEIQKSPSYSSGFALRFPRFLRLRDDKPLDEVASIYDIERMYQEQK